MGNMCMSRLPQPAARPDLGMTMKSTDRPVGTAAENATTTTMRSDQNPGLVDPLQFMHQNSDADLGSGWESVMDLMEDEESMDSDDGGESDEASIIEKALSDINPANLDDTRLRGFRKLAHLIEVSKHDEERMVQYLEMPGFLEALIQAAQVNNSIQTKIRGLYALDSLAYVAKIKMTILGRDGVVDVMVKAAQDGESEVLRLVGLHGLNAFLTVEGSQKLCKMNGALEAFVAAAQQGPTNSIKVLGLRGLWGLSSDRSTAARLVDEFEILSWLKDVKIEDPDEMYPYIYVNLAMSPRARAVMLEDDATIAILEGLTRLESGKNVVLAKMTLAILKGSDEKYLEFDKATLNMVLKSLDASLTGRSFMNTLWTMPPPLLALRYLTTRDKNRELLGTDLLEHLKLAIDKALKENDVESVELALSSLAQYALDNKTLSFVKADPTYLKIVEGIRQSKESDEKWIGAVNAASGIIFNLTENEKKQGSSPSQVTIGHVMISYAWGPPPHENQKLATEVEDYLVRAGYSVWRDEEQMRADIMQAMADGVKSSEKIIVLVNKNYMESANCKRELNFAINCKRPIIPLLVQHGYNHRTDGWLGVAIGELLYYDISSPKSRSVQLEAMLTKELKFDSTKKQVPKLTKAPSLRLPNVFVPENADQVREWVAKCGISGDVADALIKEGYLTGEDLEDLSKEDAFAIQKFLKIEQSAKAKKLRRELVKLFPPVPGKTA